MDVYAIADSDESDDVLNTPVFDCGQVSESAIALFTDEKYAQSFIAAASWGSKQTVAELETSQAARLMLEAYEEDVRFLAIDPQFGSGEAAAIVPITDHPVEAATELHKQLSDQNKD